MIHSRTHPISTELLPLPGLWCSFYVLRFSEQGNRKPKIANRQRRSAVGWDDGTDTLSRRGSRHCSPRKGGVGKKVLFIPAQCHHVYNHPIKSCFQQYKHHYYEKQECHKTACPLPVLPVCHHWLPEKVSGSLRIHRGMGFYYPIRSGRSSGKL